LRYTFHKTERLCSQKLIEVLMQRSNPSFLSFPVVFSWCATALPPGTRAQVLISVSKRKFSRASDRNRIKRLLREAYRLNKHLLYERLGEKQVILHINYIASEIVSFQSVNVVVQSSLARIGDELKK
jgi:ribonuclease P protein component